MDTGLATRRSVLPDDWVMAGVMDELKGRNVPAPVLGIDVEEKPVKQRAVRVAEEPQPDGSLAYRYSDGSIRNSNGHMLAPLPGVAPITNANARQMQAQSAQTRRNRAMRAAQRRTLREAAAIDPTVTDWTEAWGEAVAKQYVALWDSDKPKGDDLLRIGQALGAIPLAHEAKPQESDGTVAGALDSVRGLLRDITLAARALHSKD